MLEYKMCEWFLSLFLFHFSLKGPGLDAFNDYVSRVEAEGPSAWLCTICSSFRHRSKHNVQNHIEAVHFPNSFEYNCRVCGKVFNTRNKYYKHMSMYHKYDR